MSQDLGFYYQETGDGQPIILLHAGIADSRMWDEQVRVLIQDYRVITPDLRGYGNSPMPDGAFSYHGDIENLVQTLDLRDAWLVGASFGGVVAVDYCLAFPERIAGLILVGAFVSGYQHSDAVRQFGQREDELLESGDIDGATELNISFWVDGPHRSSDHVDSDVRARVFDMQKDALLIDEPDGLDVEGPETPAINRLDEIRVPTLVVVGELDRLEAVEFSSELADKIPSAQREVISDAAHMATMEQPDKFNELVLKFISKSDDR